MTVYQFDLKLFSDDALPRDQYTRQLHRLSRSGKEVVCIEQAVRGALTNLKKPGRKSFVIYGQPQSGKTEMMICLTAKLLDEGRTFIIHLLNDSVDLLGQNLGRFQESGLAPAAKNYLEVLDPTISLRRGPHVLFCKKNAKDLQKLFNKIGAVSSVVIIDDEADYASPNAKVNRAERTKINELIAMLLGDSGDYIGVTATPARLDLNNTFDNDSKLWVDFDPHSQYTGQDIFFPSDKSILKSSESPFRLTFLAGKGDEPRFLRTALFGFMVNVAYLNLYNNSEGEENYSMLIHTSGKKIDHRVDWEAVQRVIGSLIDSESANHARYLQEVWTIAHQRYPDANPNNITCYVRSHVYRNAVILLNSDRDLLQNGRAATKPSSLFTLIIGGNIVSRGVTFDNLLSMFFTRDAKHRIQQDTYIQRARMFGSRGKYLRFFELTMPEKLYDDWHRCFLFHRLSLQSIKSGKGSPVWLSDSRIAAVAGASIDKSTVDIDRGEMAFAIFPFSAEMDDVIANPGSAIDKMEALASLIGDDGFPKFIRDFVLSMTKKPDSEIKFQQSGTVYPSMTPEEQDAISRSRGMMGSSQTAGGSLHAFKIFRNDKGRARLYYKFGGSIAFSQNKK